MIMTSYRNNERSTRFNEVVPALRRSTFISPVRTNEAPSKKKNARRGSKAPKGKSVQPRGTTKNSVNTSSNSGTVRKKSAVKSQKWTDLQKRKLAKDGDPTTSAVDGTFFMRGRAQNLKRRTISYGRVSEPSGPNNLDLESSSDEENWQVASSSSQTLPASPLTEDEAMSQKPVFSSYTSPGNSDVNGRRKEVLDKSNIKVNNLREILKDDFKDNKELTINLVVRSGSSQKPQELSNPAVEAEKFSKPHSENRVDTNHAPDTAEEAANASDFKAEKTPVIKQPEQTTSKPEVSHKDSISYPLAAGHGMYRPSEAQSMSPARFANTSPTHNRRPPTPLKRDYISPRSTFRRSPAPDQGSVLLNYANTGGPFHQPTFVNNTQDRPDPAFTNMQDVRYNYPDRFTQNLRPETPDHLRRLSAKHFLRQKDKYSRQYPTKEKQPWVDDPTRYEGISPLSPRRNGKENRAPQKNVSTLTGELQYLIKNPRKRPKSRPNSGAGSLSSKGSVIMLDYPRVTKRVKDSTAQTDLDYDDEFDVQSSPSPRGRSRRQEIAIQTNRNDAQPKTKNSGSQWYDTDLEISKEVSIQVNGEDFIFNKTMATQVGSDDLKTNKETSTQTRDSDVPKRPVTMATQTDEVGDWSRSVPPNSPPISTRLYKTNDLFHKINGIMKEEGNHDSGFHDNGSPSDAGNQRDGAVYSWDIMSGYEEYYMYMRTEQGDVIGPFHFEVEDMQLGLPSSQQDTSEGLRNRATGSNSVNEHSSRSHSMLTLNIDSELCDPDDDNLYITKHGKLTFVDLAGSEKTKTGAEIVTDPGHMTESNNINKSLLVLGNCISALGDVKKRHGHIPYRDSKLTKLLADSLGGQGVTLMIACVAPSSANSAESMNTLRYANRAKKIKSKPVIKMDPRERLIVSLKREIKVLRQENHYLRQQLEFPVKPRGQLQKENDAKFLQMLQEQKKEGKVSDHGLYEMLQEYMLENETLRHENSDLHQVRDGSRREQQVLARENERLQRKVDRYERERASMQSPMSVYSVTSTVSRKSFDPQYNGQPYANGHHDNREDPQWDYRQPNGRGQKNQPHRHRHHQQMKPPHHLDEPVNKNNPAYSDNYPNSYSNQYRPQREIPDEPPTERERATQPRSELAPPNSRPRHSDQSPSRIPKIQKDPPLEKQNNYSNRQKPPNASRDDVKPQNKRPGFNKPAGKAAPIHKKSPPQRRKPNRGALNNQPALVTINSDEDMAITDTDEALRERLRQDLVDLQGQIRNQTHQNTNNRTNKGYGGKSKAAT